MQLGWLHLLAVVKSAVNPGIPEPLQDSAFNSSKYAEVDLLDHIVILIFWGASILVFSTVAVLSYSPTDSMQEFQLLCLYTSTAILMRFDFCFPNE